MLSVDAARIVLEDHLYIDDMGGIELYCREVVATGSNSTPVQIRLIRGFGKVVGCTVVSTEAKYAVVYVFVQKPYRGIGLASKAVRKAIRGVSGPILYQEGEAGTLEFWERIAKDNPKADLLSIPQYTQRMISQTS